MNTNYTKTVLDSLAAIHFSPTPAQIRVKETFWSSTRGDKAEVPTAHVDAQAAILRSSNERVARWWGQPGFLDWFLEPDYEQLQAKSTAQLAMNEITAILMEVEMKPEVKVSAAKVAREYYDRLVPKKVEKMADSAVQEMTPEELKEFIRRNTAAISK